MATPDNSSCLAARTCDVVSNHTLCREHLRLTIAVPGRLIAAPGQFVHLCPPAGTDATYRTFHWPVESFEPETAWHNELQTPMLRRAFSIAGLRQRNAFAEVDVIYRVVGTATRWMASLRSDDSVSMLGPLGNAFPIHPTKEHAWLVAGGVGLPPMLWLAEALCNAGKRTVAFCGARSQDLLPLSLRPDMPLARDATRATPSAVEFSRIGANVVISTDDGSLGFAGHIGAAMAAFHAANPVSSNDLVVYTCGPERMMRFVAEYGVARSIDCHVCMERNMACGTGLCQSCVVPVSDTKAIDGWRYQLCCTDGPVFAAGDILWDSPAR